MGKVLLTISTTKGVDVRAPQEVGILLIDEETNEVVVDLRLTSAEFWDVATGRALVVDNHAQARLTDARIGRLRDLCTDEEMPSSFLRRRVLAILNDKGWGKTP